MKEDLEQIDVSLEQMKEGLEQTNLRLVIDIPVSELFLLK